MTTALGGVIDFLKDFGFFDVILPFLLVFTVIFGILEKTKIFGVETIDGKEFPKKNLNSMVAFVIAFFVVAAKGVVASFQLSLPKIALLLIILISFLLLVGSFMGDKQLNFENNKFWKVFLTIIIFIAVVLIFIDSFGWLSPTLNYLFVGNTDVLVPIVLVLIIFGAIAFIVGGKGGGNQNKSQEGEE
ncbi:MAG: hypothetical protein U9Q69_06410 [Nanoarchaeota archaeon]|nr:hypothetical protein [Nanoarchaeota archaeon]